MITLPYFDLTAGWLGEPAPTINVFGGRRKFGLPDPEDDRKLKMILGAIIFAIIIVFLKTCAQRYGH